MADDARAKALIKAFQRAKERRHNHDNVWQEVGDLVIPSRSTFTRSVVEGENRRRKALDSTAEDANEMLAAGLHGMLTSRAQRWFYIQASDKSVRDKKPVKLWTEAVMDEMYAVFNSPQSQFHNALDQAYLDLGAFGTAVIFAEDSPRPGVVFHSRHLAECYIEINAQGAIDTLYRSWRWQLSQVVDEFGEESLPDSLSRVWKQGGDPEVRMLHAVLPRRDRNYQRGDARNMPFASLWILEEHSHLLSEGGFRDFPYLIPRWRVRTSEVYGVGPGVRALPDVNMLNAMKRTLLVAAQKVVDPPLQVPDDGFLATIRTAPGALNFYQRGSQDRIEPILTGGRPDIGQDMVDDQKDTIRRMFYNDAFDITRDSDGQNVKATFTMSRRDDKFRQLEPIFARLDMELLGPAVLRTYNVLGRQRRFPEPPPELEGGIEIDYVSPIARAQRGTEADDIMRTFEMAAVAAELDPEAIDEIDASAAVRIAGSTLFNVPAEIMRSPEEVEARRQARREQQQQQQLVEAGGVVAGALRDTAAAQKDFNAS